MSIIAKSPYFVVVEPGRKIEFHVVSLIVDAGEKVINVYSVKQGREVLRQMIEHGHILQDNFDYLYENLEEYDLPYSSLRADFQSQLDILEYTVENMFVDLEAVKKVLEDMNGEPLPYAEIKAEFEKDTSSESGGLEIEGENNSIAPDRKRLN